jgi:flavin-dependent dehydrogenase
LPSYQVDREVLDEHVLSLAKEAGADVWRPAKVASIEISEAGPSRLKVRDAGGEREVFARWVIDASGRATLLARRLELLRSLPEHPTNAIWARFRNVRDWDGYDLLSRFPSYASSCQVSRASATNHLTGYGWWCWIIPLRGGDYSAGFAEFPFEGLLDGVIVSRLMAFYNQRLARIAQKRQAAGVYGSMNLDSRTLLKGFEPNRHVWKLILRGVRMWFRAELRSLFLPAPSSAPIGSPASAV